MLKSIGRAEVFAAMAIVLSGFALNSTIAGEASQAPAAFVVTDPGQAGPSARIVVQWNPKTGTGYDWSRLRQLQTDNRTPENIMRLSVEYLVEGVASMTGRMLEVSSGNDLSRGIVLTTLAGAPPALQNDPEVIAALRNTGEDAYNANEAFFIRSEPHRLLIIANKVDGLNAAVVELLESVGYEILGMGKNWIYVPDFKNRPLAFAIKRAGRPSFYIRGLNPMGGQDRGRGTINHTPPHPDDESVRVSTMRWRTGFRLWGTSMPPYPGHALDSYHKVVLEKMEATRTTDGFLCPKTIIAPANQRPEASKDNNGFLWIDSDSADEVQVYLSNGSTWVRQDPARGVKLNLDLSVPLVRNIVLEEMVRRAAVFFESNPDGIYIFATDPEDGGGYASFGKYVRYPNWYPEYRKSQGVPLGQPYRLDGFRGLDQPFEVWDADSPSNQVFAFNSWLLSEYDRWVDSLPPSQRLTATGKDKKEQVRCSFYSYNYHDVPPEFNPDYRCRVMVAGYPKHRGRGKWVNFGNQLALAAAFKALLPREPSGDYRIISLADYWDSTMDGLPASWSASPESLVADLQRAYHAGIKSLMMEMDFNFGKNGLGYYLISKLLWDINLNPQQLDAIRDRWLQRAYGSGWEQMKIYYDFMLKDNYPSNSSGAWSRAIRMIEAADDLIDPQREPDAQKRLDDLKQFWYFYYLLDSGKAKAKAPEMREFLWKGQMSYITAMEMVIDFFPEAGSRNPVDVVGSYANGPAHYAPGETQDWWEKVLNHWQYLEVNDFADAVLANGVKGRQVDLLDLVAIKQFQSLPNSERPYYIARRQASMFYTKADTAGRQIGFNLFWAFKPNDNDSRQRSVGYGVDYWDADSKSWQSIVDQTMTDALSQLFVDRQGKQWQVVKVRLQAPYAGNYRVNIDPIGDVEARLTALSYDLRDGEYRGIQPMTYASTRPPAAGSGKAWFYIPKGTASLDLEFAGTRDHRLTLHAGQPGARMQVSREVTLSEQGAKRIALKAGEDGNLASIEPTEGDTFYFPYLYSVPTLWARSPEALLVPRAIAEADGLTPVK